MSKARLHQGASDPSPSVADARSWDEPGAEGHASPTLSAADALAQALGLLSVGDDAQAETLYREVLSVVDPETPGAPTPRQVVFERALQAVGTWQS